MIYILIRNDDLCALNNSARERKLLELFEQYQIPQVFAVIPQVAGDPHNNRLDTYYPLHQNPDILKILLEYQDKGLIEVAQHGFHHQTNHARPSLIYDISEFDYMQGIDRKWLPYQPAYHHEYSEFNGLPFSEQRERILQGKEYHEQLLNHKLKTFIFPWNTYDQACLQILRDYKFDFVLCENDIYPMDGIYSIGCCCWDISRFPYLIEEALSQKHSTLLHLSYHSWMISDREWGIIKKTLKLISENQSIKCILPHQIPHIPKIKEVLKSSLDCENMTERANQYLNAKIISRKFYVFNQLYYLKRSSMIWFVYMIAKYFGITKFLFGIFFVLFVVIGGSVLSYKHSATISLFNFVSVLLLGFFFCGAILLWARERWAKKF